MDNMPKQAPYGVYARTDDAGRITVINSDAFVDDTTGWTKIDEGYGDRYHHAQGNYLPGPLWDDRGICRYKLVDGQAVERTTAEMNADYTPPTPVLTPEDRMDQIEAAMMELASILEGGTT